MIIIEKSFGDIREMEVEEWSALWGCDSWGPLGVDGAYFYNFATFERTPEFLIEFLRVIDIQIKQIEERLKEPNNDFGWTKYDLSNMGLLQDHVNEILKETLADA